MILVRHGESEFNVVFAKTRKDPGIRDPALTARGRAQIEAAASIVRQAVADGRVDADLRPRWIMASPYRRTLQSAEILSRILGLPIHVEPIVREHAAFACDVGTARTDLVKTWPHVDWTRLEAERWWPSEPETEQIVDGRARRFRGDRLSADDWKGMLVVSHWGFIRALTGHTVPNATVLTFDPGAPHPGGGEVVSTPSL